MNVAKCWELAKSTPIFTGTNRLAANPIKQYDFTDLFRRMLFLVAVRKRAELTDALSHKKRQNAGMRNLTKARWFGAILVLAVVAWLLSRKVVSVDWHALKQAWFALPASSIAASLALSVVSFCMLALLDVFATRLCVRQRVSAKRAAFAGAVSHAFSNTLGFAALTGSVIRYRIYRGAGLCVGDIARVVTLAGFGVAMGFIVVTTFALLWQPTLPQGWGRLLGAVACVALLAFLLWLRETPRRVLVVRWILLFPGRTTALLQMATGGVEMLAAIGALYVLMPAGLTPTFVDFIPIYVAAVLVGIASQVPGGLGVFELMVLAAFPAQARADALAAMLCYRITYSIVPCTVAGAVWLMVEWRAARTKRRGTRVNSTADTAGSTGAGAGSAEPARLRPPACVRSHD